MPARSSTRLSARERRQRILDAAADTFAAGGYHATSIREIAERAGVTKPVLYDHFASKQRLYIDLIEGARDELTGRGAVAMRAGGPLEARVRAAIDAFFAFVAARPALAEVLFRPPEGEPGVVDAAERVQREATAQLLALVASEPTLLAGAADRELRLHLSMEFVKRGLHGLAGWWREHPETEQEKLVDAVMDLAWSGLGTQLTGDERGTRP